jgi:NHL repeat
MSAGMGRNAVAVIAVIVSFALWLVVGRHDAYASKTAPLKEIVLSHFGEQVDKTTGSDVCVLSSGDECGAGLESASAGGFAFPNGVAVAPNGNLYVAESVNNRVQELTPSGQFVSMFGWEVNETKDANPSATQAEKSVCTAASGDICRAGVGGEGAGQMSGAYSLAIDPESGNVYVQDLFNWRVDVFDSEGAFLFMLGQDVNRTKVEQAGASQEERNICTAASGDVCQKGTHNPPTSLAHGAFSFAQSAGSLLAVGGPEHLLYVGDEHRVQEFDAKMGTWHGEISLMSLSSAPESKVIALALDDSCSLAQPPLSEPSCKEKDPHYGDLYLVYKPEEGTASVIRQYAEDGTEVSGGGFPLTLQPRAEGEQRHALALAIDLSAGLAVSEVVTTERGLSFGGSLFGTRTGGLITEFEDASLLGLAFGQGGEFYGVSATRQEVVAFHPVPVAELHVTPGAPCTVAPNDETDVVYGCALAGQVITWGVRETEAWFEWGETGFEHRTPAEPIGSTKEEGEEEPPVSIGAAIAPLRPNARYLYRVAAYDANVQPPESHLSSETGSFFTPYVAPKIVGVPGTLFVRPFSVVMDGEVNPENASTSYFFEYAPERKPGTSLDALCPNGMGKEAIKCEEVGVRSTAVLVSSLYGKVSAVQEARSLSPNTKYRFRLSAVSEDTQQTQVGAALGSEGEFTTPPVANPQAVTGPYTGLAATSVTISGFVNPGGEPATFVFEVGVDHGLETLFGSAFSGSVPAASAFVPESVTLNELQPGTTYAYRIGVKGGSGVIDGVTMTFTTPPLPPIPPLVETPPMLSPPPFVLPEEGGRPLARCKHGYKRVAGRRCVKVHKRSKRHGRRRRPRRK